MRDIVGERKKVREQIRQGPWYKEFVARHGEEPNLSDTADYDYFTAVKMGHSPQRDPFDQNAFHWDSYAENAFGRQIPLKSPDHPTRWKGELMRETGINPDAIGLQTPQQGEEWLQNWRQQQQIKQGNKIAEALKRYPK
jgi:hypothetical protein